MPHGNEEKGSHQVICFVRSRFLNILGERFRENIMVLYDSQSTVLGCLAVIQGYLRNVILIFLLKERKEHIPFKG